MLPLFVFLPISVVVIKIFAVLHGLFRNPLRTIAAIPFNWRRVTLCVDACYIVEMMTGSQRVGGIKNAFGFANLAEAIANIRVDLNKMNFLLWPFILIIIIWFWLGYLFGFAYRWSLKSTALIWSPLLWVVISARGTGIAKVDLSYIRDWQIYSVMRTYSAVVIAAFAAKMWLFFTLERTSSWLQSRSLNLFLAPHVLPSWQLAAVVNAAIAWGLYFFAQRQLVAMDLNDPTRPSDITVRWILGWASVVRNLLSFWAIFCLLALAWQLEWPQFRFRFLPW